MRLGLINTISANGAGGLNTDGLALDLQFAADKTLTARKGPNPILTRASSGTFVGSDGLIQSAGNNIARFDHDPVTLASRGLLIEETRQNLLVQSENFGTTWSSVNLNQTGTPPYLNVATAPDGATTADKLIATATNATHQFRQDVTLVSGTAYTISVYFKAAETNFATISVVGVANGSVDWVSYFNISASSPAAGQFNGFASTSLVDVGNGWRRCSVTFTATASGSLNTRFGGASSANLNSNFYIGDGTSGIFIWGAQLEAGSFPTSYIPTTTASVVRSADVCSITGAAFSGIWNPSEGSTFFNGISAGRGSGTFGNAAMFLDIASSTINRFSQYATGNGAIRPELRTNNVDQYAPTSITYGNNTVARQSVGFRAGETSSAFFNNTAFSGGTNIALTMPTVNGLYIGSSSLPSNFVNGTISSIRYYRKRLPNAKLQTLTV